MGKDKKEPKEKPLDKMTANELREIGKTIPEISGVFGMNKAELIQAIKKARGIKDTSSKKKDSAVRDIKLKIKALKNKRQKAIDAEDKKIADILRRKICRLKKKTRKAA